MHQLDMLSEIMLKQQNAEREAHIERRYLIRMAQEQHRVSLYRPLLAGLGRRLVTWGTQLQQRGDDRIPVREVTFARSSK
jgi:hypothetical protein